MAIQMTYDSRNENAKAYKDYLTKNAAKFGLTPEQIEKIPNPVLVRQVGDDADVNAIINSTEGGARLGSSEQAKVDADKLKQSTLEKFVDNGKGEILNPGNRSFLRAAVQDIKTDTDANTFFTDKGQITQQGAERVRNALFAKAYNDSYILARMSEATDSNSKNVLKAMIAAAPKVAKVNDGIKNGEIYPEYDVAKVITDSVKKLMSLRDANKPLDFYLNENSLFDEENSEENKAMLKFMDGNKFKVREMAELFNGLADRAFAMGNPAQGNMFGDMERPTMVELIKNTIKDIKGRTGDLDYDQEDTAQGRMEATESTGSGQTHRPETQGMAAEGSTPQNTEGTVANESTQTSESGETPQHNDENAEPQQTQAAEASESKQNKNQVADKKISVEENIFNGKKALQHVLDTHQDVENAMYRPDVGSIDFLWGTPGKGKKFKKGYGISHILEKRNYENNSGTKTLDKLVEVIAKGTDTEIQKAVHGSGESRLKIHYEGYTAVLNSSNRRIASFSATLLIHVTMLQMGS